MLYLPQALHVFLQIFAFMEQNIERGSRVGQSSVLSTHISVKSKATCLWIM